MIIRGTKFNEEQVKLILSVRKMYENQCEDEYFDEDTFERDLWHTMNRSGLFEDDDENSSGITNWGVSDTRRFITEYNI